MNIPGVAVLLATLVIILPEVAFSEEDRGGLPEFQYPDPSDYNLTLSETNLTWGYNPWMPKYIGGDTNKTTFVMMTGGCIPVEEGGSDSFQDARNGWWDTCDKLGIECLCRPIVKSSEWNVPVSSKGTGIYQGMHHCSWEIRRILDEHRRGLIKLGGISAKCDLRHPEIYDEARELRVPVFLMEKNAPKLGDEDYGKPEPDAYIGSDHEFLGRTMARVLKQLAPNGGKYGFVMAWESSTALRQRDGFNDEMADNPSDQEDRATWTEVERYPYERPYNLSVECHHMECQMEGLVTKTHVDSLVFLFTHPLRNPNYTNWVDSNSFRNLTLISRGELQNIHLLGSGHLNGLVGEIHYDMGKRSAEVLLDTFTKLALGQLTFPLKINEKDRLFASKLLSYSVIPLDLYETQPVNLDQNLLGNLVYVGYVGFGLIMLTAMACVIWTVLNRNAIVVRSAQPFFLIMVVSGIIIFASTIIPLSFDDSGDPETMGDKFAVAVCMSQPWLAFTGFTVIFSALFSKTWRVNRLFHTKKGNARVEISQMDVLAPFAATFTCNVIVLACWTAIDPLTYTRLSGEGTDLWNREIETYGACRSDNALAFLLPLAIINMVVLGIACWQAFEGRRIESAFSESRYIGYSVASLFQAFLTGIPIVVIVKDDPRTFYLVLTLMIFVLSEGILVLIFLPKIILAYQFSHMTDAEQKKAMSEQIRRSTRHADSGVSSNIGRPVETASAHFLSLSPVKNVIRKIPPEHEDAIPEGVDDIVVPVDAALPKFSLLVSGASRSSARGVEVSKASTEKTGTSEIDIVPPAQMEDWDSSVLPSSDEPSAVPSGTTTAPSENSTVHA